MGGKQLGSLDNGLTTTFISTQGRAWLSHLNRCKIHVLTALMNLFLARRRLLIAA